MLTPFADVDDVTASYGELTVAEAAKVEVWLVEASNKLRVIARKRRVDLDALIAGDELANEIVKTAVVNAVKRVLINPKGSRQKSRTAGPWTESETVDTSLSSGAIYIADADIDGLFPSTGGRIMSFGIKAGMR